MDVMEMHGERGIREIIEACPAVKAVLDAHGIGCGACEPGTCRFMDIVTLHPLTAQQEKTMLARIADLLAAKAPAEVA